MTILKHIQKFKHDPENGVYGDCWRTVVACLLKLPRDAVPHVCNGPDDGKETERMREFLDGRGCAMIQVPFSGDRLEDVLAAGARCSGGLHYALMGTSRTGVNHVVICLEDKIVHDTSLTQSGIVGPANDGLWWLEWYVQKPGANRAQEN